VVDPVSSHVWQNTARPNDVNNDGSVTPLDALIIFNYLNTFGPGPVPTTGSPPPFYDVNGDDSITPLDALRIFNELNTGGSPEGEGPAAAARAADSFFAGLGAPQGQGPRRHIRGASSPTRG
jgi:hypothetical protein